MATMFISMSSQRYVHCVFLVLLADLSSDHGVCCGIHGQLLQWSEHQHVDGMGLLCCILWRCLHLALLSEYARHPALSSLILVRWSTTRSHRDGLSLLFGVTTTLYSDPATIGCASSSSSRFACSLATSTRLIEQDTTLTTSTSSVMRGKSILASTCAKKRQTKRITRRSLLQHCVVLPLWLRGTLAMPRA